MKNLIKKWFGIDKLEENLKVLKEMESKAVAATAEAQEAEQQAKMTPKDRANARGEPYVAVLDTHVNKENVRNGFFELDWNEYFVLMLRNNGYTGVTEEEIVDQWFSDLCREVGSEENVPSMDRRGSGYINVNNLGNGRTEVS